jgi:hypothetical protein
MLSKPAAPALDAGGGERQAVVKRCYHDSPQQLDTRMSVFIEAYNHALRLKTLTPSLKAPVWLLGRISFRPSIGISDGRTG